MTSATGSAKTSWVLLKDTAIAWSANNAARLGAALAFYSALSLAPMSLLLLTVGGFFWNESEAKGQIVDQMTAVLGPQGAETVQGILNAAAHNHNAGMIATLTTIATLLFSASGVFGELQAAMNVIWHVKPKPGRAVMLILRDRFLSFIMVIGSGFIMLISLLINFLLSAIMQFVTDLAPGVMAAAHIINGVVSFGIVSLLFAITFKAVPDTRVPWRSVWVGALLTAVLFNAGKTLIGLYLGHAAIASSYGAAGSFVVLLLWVYYSAQILFFGAQFTYVYSCHYHLHADCDPGVKV